MIPKHSTELESPIEELHRIRREISDQFGGDIEAIEADAAKRLKASGRTIWKPKLPVDVARG